MRIARIFPRRTRATPTDSLVFVREPPGLFPPIVDAVHVSVTFTRDIPRAKWLARQWECIAPTTIGGPAVGTPAGEFEPGLYLKHGYVITSRGCPNRCWFCDAWRRDGPGRELIIRRGWNVLDDNLLACSDRHVAAVFRMLGQESGVQFTGGLEAARLKDWHIDALWELRPRQMFFAYDGPEDLEPLVVVGRKMLARGWTTRSHRLRCYVLIGYPRDTLAAAEQRLRETIAAGFLPMAMLWRDQHGSRAGPEWRKLQRVWARPAITASAQKNLRSPARGR